ncbi:hypothetical protein HME9302_00887 [Alteripontixanthobacter maritimus]|uniref:SGNH hydrolase-type esterase domain-containing protein n=1 Tax=Alteripontixanthobacter maritimus TaxID=2161824 RepID=A0A369Q839_9SPHN|nr:hypothetical protein [Alteripontixanthobacter maritimus]RDC59695.1 hypothetical protein HME9302_00887 [Alteripontixanthobacter maritimus]
MERLLFFVTLFASGSLAGAGLFQLNDYDPPAYPDSRTPFVVNLAQQFGKADTLVLGDSLIEQTNMDGACGTTFNGGIGGARLQHAIKAAPELIQATDPDTIVIALGANHFAAGNEIGDFRRLYPQLLELAGERELVLVGVPNSDVASRNVAALARKTGATYVPAIKGPTGPDGLHHNAEGSRAYREAISQGCARA